MILREYHLPRPTARLLKLAIAGVLARRLRHEYSRPLRRRCSARWCDVRLRADEGSRCYMHRDDVPAP